MRKSFCPTGSHQKVLDYAVRATHGPVLECGTGYFSTPLLHGLCCPERRLVSLEPDPFWIAMFAGFIRDGHEIELIGRDTTDWLEAAEKAAAGGLGVAFLDQDSDTWVNRVAVAELVQDLAEVIVIHDINRRQRGVPMGVRRFLEDMRYSRVFPGEGRNFGTAAASRTVDVTVWPPMEG